MLYFCALHALVHAAGATFVHTSLSYPFDCDAASDSDGFNKLGSCNVRNDHRKVCSVDQIRFTPPVLSLRHEMHGKFSSGCIARSSLYRDSGCFVDSNSNPDGDSCDNGDTFGKILQDIHLLSDLRRDSYAALLEIIPPSVQIVLIGEGTHGTEEFFRIRSEVTQCLLQHHGHCLSQARSYEMQDHDDTVGKRQRTETCNFADIGESRCDYEIEGKSNSFAGFDAILCEGDVQPFFELNQFVTNTNRELLQFSEGNVTPNTVCDEKSYSIEGIRSLLQRLFSNHFPDWMWSNVPMIDFVTWLRAFNVGTPVPNKDEKAAAKTAVPLEGDTTGIQSKITPVQLLGIDIQSPFSSIEHVIQQLTSLGESELATVAQCYYEPLYKFRPNARKYGDFVYGNKVPSQEITVCKVLNAVLEKYKTLQSALSIQCGENGKCFTQNYAADNSVLHDLRIWFELLEHAQAIVASEAYHRQRIYPGHVTTWNLRSNAFLGSILRTMDFIRQVKKYTNSINSNDRKSLEGNAASPVRLIVWAHNSHVGDMQCTGFSSLGQTSLGELCRETFGNKNVFLIGTTTYEGTVHAASADRQGSCWQGTGEVMSLTKAVDDSHEFILHSLSRNPEVGQGAFGLNLQRKKQYNATAKGEANASEYFNCNRHERFVGSCYLSQTEKMSHYTHCDLSKQFDYLFHVDASSALQV